MTVAQMLGRLAVLALDWDPATRQPAFGRFTQQQYLDWLIEAETALYWELNPDQLLPLVTRQRVEYGEDGKVLFSRLQYPLGRICLRGQVTGIERGVSLGRKADPLLAEDLAAMRTSPEHGDSHLHAAASTHAWMYGDNSFLWAFPVPDIGNILWMDLLYLRTPKTMVYQNPSGYQTMTSELPLDLHPLMLNRARHDLLVQEGKVNLAATYMQMFYGELEKKKAKIAIHYEGGAIP